MQHSFTVLFLVQPSCVRVAWLQERQAACPLLQVPFGDGGYPAFVAQRRQENVAAGQSRPILRGTWFFQVSSAVKQTRPHCRTFRRARNVVTRGVLAKTLSARHAALLSPKSLPNLPHEEQPNRSAPQGGDAQPRGAPSTIRPVSTDRNRGFGSRSLYSANRARGPQISTYI